MHTIYLITNTLNGDRYVGQTRSSLRRRWSGHCTDDRRGKRYLFNAIQKYGRENFIMEPIIEVPTQELADEFESEYIQRYCTLVPNGYNLMSGGLVSKHSEESRLKVRNARLGTKLSEDHKRKISLGLEKTKEQRSAKMKGRVISLETRKKMSLAHTGKKHPGGAYVWTVENRLTKSHQMPGTGNPRAKLTSKHVSEIRYL